jgi:hypothetical protein
MKSKTREYEFDHPSGPFTGFIDNYDDRMIEVRLTSAANCNLRIKEGAYGPGDVRLIKASTPCRPTGKTRLIAETQISRR